MKVRYGEEEGTKLWEATGRQISFYTMPECRICGNSDKCDYCVVRSENPMAKEYEIVKDEAGFLVSRKIEKEI